MKVALISSLTATGAIVSIVAMVEGESLIGSSVALFINLLILFHTNRKQ